MSTRNPIEICTKPQFWLLNEATVNHALHQGGSSQIADEVHRLKRAFVVELLERYDAAPLSAGEFLKLHSESCCPIEAVALQMAVATMLASRREAFTQPRPF